MRLPWKRSEVFQGVLIYSGGDTLAAIILHESMWSRMAVMALLGGVVYALEIPAYFAWIDRRGAGWSGWRLVLGRTALALLYFNPLWIARHLAFIAVGCGQWERLEPGLLHAGWLSWCGAIPLSIAGNAVIQGVLPLRLRFCGSAVFSALMAVYYAMARSGWPVIG